MKGPCKADPLQKNLLAASLSVLFLLSQSRYVLLLLWGAASFLVFVVQEL